MIIDDFDIRRATRATRPYEANSPLRVDPYAELAGTITFQGFETIASQGPQFIQANRSVEDFEAAVGLPGKTLKFAHETTVGKRLGTRVPIAQDHREIK
jgi:hypothetical protein